jgi:acetyltransferase-like isoleucine patch superfamily enzyme
MDDLEKRIGDAYRFLAKSDAAAAVALRRLYRGISTFSVPAPRPVVRPILLGYEVARSVYAFGKRVFVAQPLFTAYCARVGKNFRTGEQLHWVQGRGEILVGDDVWIDGCCSITFAARFSERPTLEIGDGTAIGHATQFAIGKRITLGKNCNISGQSAFFDSSGHPADPVARRRHEPPPAEQVRPITLGDDVWVGKGCIVFPGVRIGDCAIVSAGSVVRKHVPPYAVVAGNPAQIVFRLPRPDAAGRAGSVGAGAPASGVVASGESKAAPAEGQAG